MANKGSPAPPVAPMAPAASSFGTLFSRLRREKVTKFVQSPSRLDERSPLIVLKSAVCLYVAFVAIDKPLIY
jgi:hypothetical protein